jgi:hypothetical protein
MSTLYTSVMTIAVPQSLIPQANQLALIAGESPDDVNTFTNANWQDADGNRYAVCSTVIKPIVLAMLGHPIEGGELQAEGADMSLAQQALDVAVMYSDGVKATPDSIVIAIDIDPLEAFAAMGLVMVESEIDSI